MPRAYHLRLVSTQPERIVFAMPWDDFFGEYFERYLKTLRLDPAKGRESDWVFNPQTQEELRPMSDWVGRLITRMGQAANLVVSPARGGRAAKYASANDLRRSCAVRLTESGLPDRVVQRIRRNESPPVSTTLQGAYSETPPCCGSCCPRLRRTRRKVYPRKLGTPELLRVDWRRRKSLVSLSEGAGT